MVSHNYNNPRGIGTAEKQNMARFLTALSLQASTWAGHYLTGGRVWSRLFLENEVCEAEWEWPHM